MTGGLRVFIGRLAGVTRTMRNAGDRLAGGVGRNPTAPCDRPHASLRLRQGATLS
jgi:hypothetical protein